MLTSASASILTLSHPGGPFESTASWSTFGWMSEKWEDEQLPSILLVTWTNLVHGGVDRCFSHPQLHYKLVPSAMPLGCSNSFVFKRGGGELVLGNLLILTELHCYPHSTVKSYYYYCYSSSPPVGHKATVKSYLIQNVCFLGKVSFHISESEKSLSCRRSAIPKGLKSVLRPLSFLWESPLGQIKLKLSQVVQDDQWRKKITCWVKILCQVNIYISY